MCLIKRSTIDFILQHNIVIGTYCHHQQEISTNWRHLTIAFSLNWASTQTLTRESKYDRNCTAPIANLNESVPDAFNLKIVFHRARHWHCWSTGFKITLKWEKDVCLPYSRWRCVNVKNLAMTHRNAYLVVQNICLDSDCDFFTFLYDTIQYWAE